MSTGQVGSVYSLRDLKRVIQFFSLDQTNSVMDSTFIRSARKPRIFRYKLLPSCRSYPKNGGQNFAEKFRYIITSLHRIACGKMHVIYTRESVNSISQVI